MYRYVRRNTVLTFLYELAYDKRVLSVLIAYTTNEYSSETAYASLAGPFVIRRYVLLSLRKVQTKSDISRQIKGLLMRD